MSQSVAGIQIPDSKLAREATDLLREHGTPLLFAHSMRVYLFGSLRGRRRGLKVDSELLYLGAVFHDLGLTPKYRSPDHRFEVDSANAARGFLRASGVDELLVDVVWDAIALHTTPEIPWHKRPEIALVTGGVEADVLGDGLDEIPVEDQDAVLAMYPRIDFKREIVRAFADGFAYKPGTTFGTMNADLLERNVPDYQRTNFCDLIAANPLAEAAQF
jgi:HD domain